MAEKTSENAVADAGGRKRRLIVAAVAIVLLAIGVTVAILFANSRGAEDAADEQAQAVPQPAIYVSLGDKFLGMLQYHGRQHYCQMSASVLAHDESVVKALEEHAPLIRGRLVALLGEQDFAALRTDAGRQHLRERVLAVIQEILQQETGKPGIEQVFFTELVLQ